MKIAILGGSFNPPHLGHLTIAVQVKEQLNMNQVWLIPCYQHPFRKKIISPYHRLKMTKFLANNSIKCSNWEINHNKNSYSIDTLKSLSTIYPQYKFYWIVGSEQITNFTKWKNWKKIIKDYHLIIFSRGEVNKNIELKVKKTFNIQSIPKNIIIMNNKNLIFSNISSSQIRKRIKTKKSIKHLVPNKVYQYILKYNLYGEKNSQNKHSKRKRKN